MAGLTYTETSTCDVLFIVITINLHKCKFSNIIVVFSGLIMASFTSSGTTSVLVLTINANNRLQWQSA